MLDAQEREFTARSGEAVAFQVSFLPASKSLRLLADLSKMFGPALGILVDAAGGIEAKASIAALVGQKSAGDMFERVAQAIVTNLDADKMQSFVKQLCEVSRVKQSGTWVDLSKTYELVFLGQTLLQLRWLAFALEVQYADFLALRGALGQAASGAAANAPQG